MHNSAAGELNFENTHCQRHFFTMDADNQEVIRFSDGRTDVDKVFVQLSKVSVQSSSN